jgi:5-methylthioribose kinase
MSQRTFDIARACFWLIAFVIGAHVVAVLIAEGACLWHAQAIIDGKLDCNADGKLTEVLAAALAAALAFAGGHMTRRSPPGDE